MDENRDGIVMSQEKLEANRRNAQSSTGPKTEAGKNHSRLNALKHGVLASVLIVSAGALEDPADFEELVRALTGDLEPVGKLEEMLVEKIAICWWRQRRALRYEARKINERSCDRKPNQDPFALPIDTELNKVLRYEASIQRQLVHAINQLERMQRARKGEHVPAPVSVQISSDQEG
jgi:hypothetical protein